MGLPSENTSRMRRCACTASRRAAAQRSASPSTHSRNRSGLSRAATPPLPRRQGVSASLNTMWHNSLSRPGAPGLPARRQSRITRPPFHAPVVYPSSSVCAPASSNARSNTSSRGASCAMCCFIEPEQSSSSPTTQSVTGVWCGVRNRRRSVGLVTSCASRRPSISPLSCPLSQPSSWGCASSACSARASRAGWMPLCATDVSSVARSSVNCAARTRLLALASRSYAVVKAR